MIEWANGEDKLLSKKITKDKVSEDCGFLQSENKAAEDQWVQAKIMKEKSSNQGKC